MDSSQWPHGFIQNLSFEVKLSVTIKKKSCGCSVAFIKLHLDLLVYCSFPESCCSFLLWISGASTQSKASQTVSVCVWCPDPKMSSVQMTCNNREHWFLRPSVQFHWMWKTNKRWYHKDWRIGDSRRRLASTWRRGLVFSMIVWCHCCERGREEKVWVYEPTWALVSVWRFPHRTVGRWDDTAAF